MSNRTKSDAKPQFEVATALISSTSKNHRGFSFQTGFAKSPCGFVTIASFAIKFSSIFPEKRRFGQDIVGSDDALQKSTNSLSKSLSKLVCLRQNVKIHQHFNLKIIHVSHISFYLFSNKHYICFPPP